jgi:2-polyprenyl-3-methyl-5-hydroxy-6-metoxy-1,4-benzoquinol methylase
MFDVLEHIPKTDIVDLLRDISRSLKAHGNLFIRVPNAANPFNSQILFDDFTHEVYFTGTSLRQVCSIAGYKNIAILPWLEEGTSWISKLTNRSAPIMKQFLYAFMGFSRLYFNPNNPMSRNIFCICSK